MATKSDGRRYKVGDQVRFRFGLHTPLATIVEDRGLLAVGRKRLYRVRFEFDDPPNVFFTEVPEDDILPLA
jgi:hypothetical protein